jgi:hypothetical protein
LVEPGNQLLLPIRSRSKKTISVVRLGGAEPNRTTENNPSRA